MVCLGGSGTLPRSKLFIIIIFLGARFKKIHLDATAHDHGMQKAEEKEKKS